MLFRSSWQATNAADPTNASKILIATNGSTDVQLVSGINGTGTYLPLSFFTNGSGQFAINNSGAWGIGSVSGATGTVVSITTPTTLVTSKQGALNFLFYIPNTDAVRFRTGSRELKLIDASTSTGQWTSRGRGIYRAEGILETKQATINAVRNAEIVKEVIGPNDDPAARQTIIQKIGRAHV